MQRWIGRVALVTGASGGIGAAICKELVQRGMIVVGCARAANKIQALASGEEVSKAPGKLHAIQCDLSRESEILAMFSEIRQKFGHVDVCINNAGIGIDSLLDSGKTEDWRSMLEVNVMGLCICTRESLLLMKERNIEDGQIIHMGSVVGHRVPIIPNVGIKIPGFGVYNGTKFMVRALAESLRQELKAKSSRIRVATISPGAVETEFMVKSLGSEVSKNYFQSYTSLKSKDIADAVTYVLSAKSHMNIEDVIVQPVGNSY